MPSPCPEFLLAFNLQIQKKGSAGPDFVLLCATLLSAVKSFPNKWFGFPLFSRPSLARPRFLCGQAWSPVLYDYRYDMYLNYISYHTAQVVSSSMSRFLDLRRLPVPFILSVRGAGGYVYTCVAAFWPAFHSPELNPS